MTSITSSVSIYGCLLIHFHYLVNLQEAGVDWIIHLDTDELLHPAGTSEYSLRRLLADLPEDVDMVVFPNYVSDCTCSS